MDVLAQHLVRIPVLLALACGGPSGSADREVLATLATGTYKATAGRGYAPAEQARVLAVTARLDRSARKLVFTFADGSQRSMDFTPRPQAQWKTDCYTMASHVREETADLGPGALQIESMQFRTPVVYAKCGPNRMILGNGLDDEGFFLSLDLQP